MVVDVILTSIVKIYTNCECNHILEMARRIVARETPRTLAVAAMLFPWAQSCRALAFYSSVSADGRPIRRPAARAASRPARVRSLMRVRSYSANAPASW